MDIIYSGFCFVKYTPDVTNCRVANSLTQHAVIQYNSTCSPLPVSGDILYASGAR